jgi:hypothetical protein
MLLFPVIPLRLLVLFVGRVPQRSNGEMRRPRRKLYMIGSGLMSAGIAAEVERAERAVDVAMGAVLQPTARRLLDEAKSLRLKFLRRVYAVDTMRALLPPGFEEEKQRLLTLIAPELMAASRVVQQDWRAVIEALKVDSDAPLPG